MARYRVYMQMVLSTSIEVEADDEAGAIEAAFESDEMPPGSICAQCGGWGNAWSIDNGDWDVIDGDDAVVLVESA